MRDISRTMKKKKKKEPVMSRTIRTEKSLDADPAVDEEQHDEHSFCDNAYKITETLEILGPIYSG